MKLFVWPLRHAPESDLTVHRHDRPGECHAFFFLDYLAGTQPDFPVPRWLLYRGLERRFPEWIPMEGTEGDWSIISDALTATMDDIERAAASFVATGSPAAWRAWQETWPDQWVMPDSLPTT